MRRCRFCGGYIWPWQKAGYFRGGWRIRFGDVYWHLGCRAATQRLILKEAADHRAKQNRLRREEWDRL